jgi:hypothetical protein
VIPRNNLVYHFSAQHDLRSFHGCRSAQETLQAAYSRIDQHFDTLRGWAEGMEQTQRLAAGMVRYLLINGIAPDGTFYWPAAGIVCALRQAAGALAVDGWAPVEEAAEWITKRYPEQIPSNYGCKIWRQVFHDSRSFELRYFNGWTTLGLVSWQVISLTASLPERPSTSPASASASEESIRQRTGNAAGLPAAAPGTAPEPQPRASRPSRLATRRPATPSSATGSAGSWPCAG